MSIPAQNPERAALAEAIVARDEAAANVKKARAGIERASQRLAAVRTEHAKAQQDVEKARAKAKTRAVGDVAVADVSTALRAMKGREQECADDVTLFEEAVAKVTEGLEEAEWQFRRAEEVVAKSAADVVRLEIEQALDQARKTQERLVADRVRVKALLSVSTNQKMRDRYSPTETEASTFLSGAVIPMAIGSVDHGFHLWPTHPGTIAVGAFFEKLKTDASAKLQE